MDSFGWGMERSIRTVLLSGSGIEGPATGQARLQGPGGFSIMRG